MKKIFLVLVIIFTSSIVFTACKSKKKEVKKEEVEVTSDKKELASKDVYQCPMKCEKEKTYEKEGKCPVCEMKLRKKEIKSHENHESHDH